MNRFRTVLVGLAVVLAVLTPLAAYAAGPTLTPASVMADNFESPPLYTITPIPFYSTPSPARWGLVTQSYLSSTHGLWCAGSLGWQTQYPGRTASYVTWTVPQLSDYYAASFGMWYVMPTRGQNDALALRMAWRPTAGSPPSDTQYGDSMFPVSGSWRSVVFDISSPDNIDNMSRTAGTVTIGFLAGDPGVSSVSGQALPTGHGPTIDDVSVTGWKYGPVRSLAVNKVGSVAHLTWSRPLRSTAANATTEERTIAYRVYREPDGSNAWTELTIDGNNTAEHFDDTDIAALSGTYRYVVQAVDAVGGYGQVVLSADSALQAFTQLPGAPVFTLTGIPSGPTSQNVTPGYSTTETAPSVAATLDGAQFTFGSIVSTEGTHTLVVRMSNAGGATEHFVIFSIDKHAPSTTMNSLPSGTILTPITVVLNSVDSMSGVRATYYSLDGGAWTTYASGIAINSFKTHTLSYHSVDNAGNSEVQHTVSIVMRRPTTLSITTSTKAPVHGHSFTLSGYLTPGVAGEHILLKYQRPGSSKWYSYSPLVHTTTSGSNGKWTWKYTPPTKGTYSFKAWYDTTTTKYRSGSPTLTLKAK